MKYVKFGNTDLTVSDIGFGAWAIGGMGWGETANDEAAVQALEKAYDEGVTLFDTCDAYGNGHSEELIGKVFEGRRDKIVIATKAGTNFRIPERSKNWGRDYLISCLDESLVRLKTDYVDLFQLHVPDGKTIAEGEIFETLDIIKKSGKARYCGLAMWTAADAILALNTAKFDSLQCPFNILNKENRETVKLAGEKGVPVLTSEPMAGGILTGKYHSIKEFNPGDHRLGFWSEERFAAVQEDFAVIQSCVKEPFETMAQLALAFNLSFPEIYCVIPGAKNPGQVEKNDSASGLVIDPEDLEKLKNVTGYCYSA